MKNDPYATEEEIRTLFQKDIRSRAERQLDKMLLAQGACEMGTESYNVLYKIAIELLEKQHEMESAK